MWKFIQIYSKQSYFLIALPTLVNGRGLRPLRSLVLLPSACGFQRVNDEPEKVLKSLFFVYFWFSLMSGIFQQTAIFYFGQKQCFYLTHSAREYFEDLPTKKKQKNNFKRLYLQKLREIRVRTKIFWKFIQTFFIHSIRFIKLPTWVHGRGCVPYNPHCLQLPTTPSTIWKNFKNISTG